MTEYYIYTTQPNDRWDLIAYKFLGNSYDYPKLIALNPHVAIKPILDEGIKILIPKEDTSVSNTTDLPIWKRE